jgi:glycosyltransferase involved in cell wall biosynthesis
MFQDFLNTYQRKKVEEHPNNVLSALPHPKVTVWMVAYNQIKYFGQAIDSVLMQQTTFDFEIVLGDDDSNDGTRELCIEYANKYPDKIRLFFHHRANAIKIAGDRPNPNFQGVYNWHQCRGQYIATLEGDDFWTDPLKLQKQVDFLDAHPEHMGVCTNFSVCDEKGTITSPNKYESIQFPDFALQYTLKFHTISRTLVCMYRNLEEVKNELTRLAHAPFLDRIILALMTQRGPMRCLMDNTATFRDGSGYFSPLRAKIGLQQLIAQWEILVDHYENSPWRKLAVAELHAAHAKLIRRGSWSNAILFWIRNLIPLTSSTHFSWKWYLRLRILGELRVPMSWYACNPQVLNTLSGSKISYVKDVSEMVRNAKRILKSTREDVIEIVVPGTSMEQLSAWKWLPGAYFELGLRFIGFKNNSDKLVSLVFVSEGSEQEKSLWVSGL